MDEPEKHADSIKEETLEGNEAWWKLALEPLKCCS